MATLSEVEVQERLADLDGWELRCQAIRRRDQYGCECPITAVANAGTGVFGINAPLSAGLFLGLTSKDASAIANAADDYSDRPLRARLLEACKIQEK